MKTKKIKNLEIKSGTIFELQYGFVQESSLQALIDFNISKEIKIILDQGVSNDHEIISILIEKGFVKRLSPEFTLDILSFK